MTRNNVLSWHAKKGIAMCIVIPYFIYIWYADLVLKCYSSYDTQWNKNTNVNKNMHLLLFQILLIPWWYCWIYFNFIFISSPYPSSYNNNSHTTRNSTLNIIRIMYTIWISRTIKELKGIFIIQYKNMYIYKDVHTCYCFILCSRSSIPL